MVIRKYIIATILLFGGVPALSGQSGQTFELVPGSVDLGEIPLKSKHRIEVVARNVGDRPVVITDIRTGCVCTKPSWNRSPVMPGDSMTVVLQFSPIDRGAFYKTVRIETTPRVVEKSEIILRGKVY